jgi:hypothetical protein
MRLAGIIKPAVSSINAINQVSNLYLIELSMLLVVFS